MGKYDNNPLLLLDDILAQVNRVGDNRESFKQVNDDGILMMMLSNPGDEPETIQKRFYSKAMEKLIDEGYVTKDKQITFDGLLFLKSGGYSQRESDLSLSREIDEQRHKLLNKYSEKTVRWTKYASLVGTLLLVWEIWKVVCQNYDSLKCFVFCPDK